MAVKPIKWEGIFVISELQKVGPKSIVKKIKCTGVAVNFFIQSFKYSDRTIRDRSSAFAAEVSPPFASSTSSSFYSSPSSSHVYGRSSSPTRVNLHGFALVMSSAVRFSLASRSGSPNRSMVMTSRDQVVRKQNAGNPLKNLPKKMCMCSPRTHPGSFWCSLHKNYNTSHATTYSPNRLNARRSTMTNSLVRICTVEGGDLVKRALAALIRPSSHQQRRRTAFKPRPSCLSIMSKADDL